jgi:hypothetical protein
VGNRGFRYFADTPEAGRAGAQVSHSDIRTLTTDLAPDIKIAQDEFGGQRYNEDTRPPYNFKNYPENIPKADWDAMRQRFLDAHDNLDAMSDADLDRQFPGTSADKLDIREQLKRLEEAMLEQRKPQYFPDTDMIITDHDPYVPGWSSVERKGMPEAMKLLGLDAIRVSDEAGTSLAVSNLDKVRVRQPNLGTTSREGAMPQVFYSGRGSAMNEDIASGRVGYNPSFDPGTSTLGKGLYVTDRPEVAGGVVDDQGRVVSPGYAQNKAVGPDAAPNVRQVLLPPINDTVPSPRSEYVRAAPAQGPRLFGDTPQGQEIYRYFNELQNQATDELHANNAVTPETNQKMSDAAATYLKTSQAFKDDPTGPLPDFADTAEYQHLSDEITAKTGELQQLAQGSPERAAKFQEIDDLYQKLNNKVDDWNNMQPVVSKPAVEAGWKPVRHPSSQLHLFPTDEPLDQLSVDAVRHGLDQRALAVRDQSGQWDTGAADAVKDYSRDPNNFTADQTGLDFWKWLGEQLNPWGDRAAQAEAANQALHDAGYDGIVYRGGTRKPMMDANGQPITHRAVLVFPEEVKRVTNATSFTAGGQINAPYAAALGGAAAVGLGAKALLDNRDSFQSPISLDDVGQAKDRALSALEDFRQQQAATSPIQEGGFTAPVARGLEAANDVLQKRRQDLDPANITQDYLDAIRSGDVGGILGASARGADVAAGPAGSSLADVSSPLSAGLTAAGVDPNLSRVLGMAGNLVAPMALEGAVGRGALPQVARGLAEGEAGTLNIPQLGRTPFGEGGLGTPRYDYPAGSDENTIASTLRNAAANAPNGVADLAGAALDGLGGLPSSAPNAKLGLRGTMQDLADLRRTADLGMNQATWYSKFAQGVANLVGDKNINEFRTLFGITSQQTTPEKNLSMTLGFMRMAREFVQDGTEFTPQNIKTWLADPANRLVNAKNPDTGAPEKYKVTGDQIGKIADLYTTGQVRVATNAKTPSYSSNILSALQNRFDPNSTMDTWMAQLFGYRNWQKTASLPEAFNAMRTTVAHVAGELGITPNQAQAAMWFPIKSAKEFARTEEGKSLRPMMRDFEAGKVPLGEFLEAANKLGALDAPSGTWEDSIASPLVKQEIARLAPNLGVDSPEVADNAFMYYPGKGTRLAGSALGLRPGAVAPTRTSLGRLTAEMQAPSVTAQLSPDALDALGHNVESGQFSSLGDIPHTVQGDHVLVPGGNMDTLRAVASHIAAADPSQVPTADLHFFMPEAKQLAGWHVNGATDPEALGAALDQGGISYVTLPDGTIRVNALPVRDANYERTLAQAVSGAGGRISGVPGLVQRLTPADYGSVARQFVGRVGQAGESGVPAAGRDLAGGGAGLADAGGPAAQAADNAGSRLGDFLANEDGSLNLDRLGRVIQAGRVGALAGGLPTLAHIALNTPVQIGTKIASDLVANLRYPEATASELYGAAQGLRAWGLNAASTLNKPGPLASSMGATSTLSGPGALETGLTGAVKLHPVLQDIPRQMANYMELYRTAAQQATDSGLARGGSAWRAEVARLVASPNASMQSAANFAAKTAGLGGGMGTTGTAISHLIHDAPLARFAMPIFDIGYKVASKGVEMTPTMGPIGTAWDVARGLTGSGPYAGGNWGGRGANEAVTPLAERVRNHLIGLALMYEGYQQAAQGNITGEGPEDPGEQAALRQTGWQPSSVKLGGRYFDAHLLGSAGWPLIAGANLYEAREGPGGQGLAPKKTPTGEQQPGVLDELGDYVARQGRYFNDETFLRGVGDILNLMGSGFQQGKVPQQEAAGVLQSLVPQGALLANYASSQDPFQRNPRAGSGPLEDIQNALLARLPGQREGLQTRISATGRQLANPQQGLGILMPRSSVIQGDPILDELAKVGVKPTNTPSSLSFGSANQVQLTPGEQYRWQQYRGQALTDSATKLMSSSAYRKLDDGSDKGKIAQRNAVAAVVSSSAQVADGKLRQELGKDTASLTKRFIPTGALAPAYGYGTGGFTPLVDQTGQ